MVCFYVVCVNIYVVLGDLMGGFCLRCAMKLRNLCPVSLNPIFLYTLSAGGLSFET